MARPDQVKRDQARATEESSEPEMKAAVEDSQRREKRTSPPDKLSSAGAVIRESGRQHARRVGVGAADSRVSVPVIASGARRLR